ncbi:helix-turn-helix domain-containing protein [Streptomyces sp. NPDC019224]|uniref:helix-turn-helix domain-containing protein n=1 Tax=Streptomyces sp. NPDC019224 TaxID=3154484 RepID=UPI0033DB49C2
MATPQVIAPPRAPSGSPGPRPDATPTSGVIHVNVRHLSGFTVIGNHLAQHRGLSLTAIGLAAHIQSLPAGARVGIKVLAARFPESEARIAAALNELEATGYLLRSRLRLTDGRVITRTTSFNQPIAPAPPPPPTPPSPPRRPAPRRVQEPPPPAPPEPAPVTAPAAPAEQPPPLPEPLAPTEELRRTATTLLAGLRRYAPSLTLSERDIGELAPAIATWLEREAHPETIRHALTSDLPVPVKHPARFVRTRITNLLPPPLPEVTEDAAPPVPEIDPFQDCDLCDRVFRAPEPGHCRDCREAEAPRAA